MRKALVVGVDYYSRVSGLYGCVNDAKAVAQVLERHGDGSKNFEVRLLNASSNRASLSRKDFKDQIAELFKGENEAALLYFAGHGHIEETGGYLLTSECESGDDGVPLGEVLTLANKSRSQNRLVLLDSCHSGVAGSRQDGEGIAELKTGMTILAASTADQYATEENGQGVFTALLVDALGGAAANLLGDVTPGSVYAHIDQSLGPWDQRPVFKTNVQRFVSLRRVPSPVSLDDLKRILDLFPDAGVEVPLDPSFEPDSERTTGKKPNPRRMADFAILQKLNRVNLVVPVGATHMYYAAMESKSCRLTPLGEHYRRLVQRGRI